MKNLKKLLFAMTVFLLVNVTAMGDTESVLSRYLSAIESELRFDRHKYEGCKIASCATKDINEYTKFIESYTINKNVTVFEIWNEFNDAKQEYIVVIYYGKNN